MNDKVISLRSRKPLEQTIAEEAQKAQEEEKASAAATLAWLDRIRGLVAKGRLEGICIVGRDPETALFFTDVMFPNRPVMPAEAVEYMGYLEMLKLEMSDVASMVPVITLDGSVLDPSAEPEDLEE